jgi:hypothetical protein
MKKLLFTFIFLFIAGAYGQDVGSTIVGGGSGGTGNLSHSDSTTMPGYTTRTSFANDTTYRALLWTLLKSGAFGDTAEIMAVLRKNMKDTVNANGIKTGTATTGYYLYSANGTDSVAFTAPPWPPIQVDTSLQVAGNRFLISAPLSSSIKIDSILVVGQGASVNIVDTVYYSANAWAAVGSRTVIAGQTCNSVTAGNWQSTISNPVVAAGNYIWFNFATVTTPCKLYCIIIRYHYASS